MATTWFRSASRTSGKETVCCHNFYTTYTNIHRISRKRVRENEEEEENRKRESFLLLPDIEHTIICDDAI